MEIPIIWHRTLLKNAYKTFFVDIYKTLEKKFPLLRLNDHKK